MPNHSIPVWSSDTYFSEGDEVTVHMNTRRRPRGISGEITNTKFRNGRRMHEVKGHWYPERDLKPVRDSSEKDVERAQNSNFEMVVVIFIIMLILIVLL